MNKKPLPSFKNEDEERAFWAQHASTGFVNWAQAKRTIFPDLKPSTKTISLRLPESVIAALKVLANKWDVPYRSLPKIFLAEKIAEESRHAHARTA
jgi:predicted DNA binding CopG/RHH family protein